MVITLESIQFLLSFVSLRRKLAISVPGSGGGSWTAWKLFVFCRLLYGVVYCVWAGVINRNTERRRWRKTGEAHITLLPFPPLQKEKLGGLVGLGTLKHYSIFLFYSWLILLAILDLPFFAHCQPIWFFKDLQRLGKICHTLQCKEYFRFGFFFSDIWCVEAHFYRLFNPRRSIIHRNH